MVKFTVLQNPKVSDSKAPNVTKDVSIEVKILALLKEKGKIERKGGERYGYWGIYKQLLIPIVPFPDGNGRVGRLILFKECLKHNIVPFIISDDLKMFYYRGLKEWNHEKGFLNDTCLTAQDRYKSYLDYFRIGY